jgi:hypothetical protein
MATRRENTYRGYVSEANIRLGDRNCIEMYSLPSNECDRFECECDSKGKLTGHQLLRIYDPMINRCHSGNFPLVVTIVRCAPLLCHSKHCVIS